MPTKKTELLSAEETARILGVRKDRLYNICKFFDNDNDDEWELVLGQHFEWLSKGDQTRRFYEEGAMAIAKYLQEEVKSKPFFGFVDAVREKITHRRKRTRQLLVRRRIISEMKDLDGIVLRNDLVFMERRRVIRVLDTNGKGLNSAAKREQNNSGLDGRQPMQVGKHFEDIDGIQHWSQIGIVQIAKNMSENLSRKSRRAWTDAVAEVVEDAIADQRKYLDSFEARLQKAMKKAKSQANGSCQVSRMRKTPAKPFDLHAHHLFDKATRRDLACFPENLLVMHEDIHDGFHAWHGSESCEPKDFIEYLTTVESWRFDTPSKNKHLHLLINRLESLQQDFKSKELVA